MPKPRSLNSTSAIYANDFEEHVLTPRTPHRHHSQYEEAHVNTSEQTVPLLLSDHTGNDRSNQPKPNAKTQKRRSIKAAVDVPLVLGVLLACFLFGLIILSYKNPEKLQEYIGIKAPTQAPSEVGPTSSDPPPPPPPPQMHPLPSEYVAQCKELNKGFMSHGDYWGPSHMIHEHTDVEEQEQGIGVEGGRMRTCSKTITYMLDGEVGLLADLTFISQAAALARERNRSFFIDDTYWNRGKWSDHFESVVSLEPGPDPGCLPPLPSDLVACPRTTRHWVITAHTAKYHFGHSFSDHYEDPYSHNLNRLRPIYDAARVGFASTIKPNTEVASLIHSARQELQERKSANNLQSNQQYIGVHVRRGDCKPLASTFHSPYAPITEYTTAVISTHKRLRTDDSVDDSFVYFASDPPEAEEEFENTYEGSDLYFSLRKSHNPGLKALASSEAYEQHKFNQFEAEKRYHLTRGMIIDFALLSGMWARKDDPVPIAGICTISSTVCKMMAVGLGWEKAFGEVDDMGYLDEKHKGWVEIEQKGRIVPVWSAFTLFYK